jgi:hypothetical protein
LIYLIEQIRYFLYLREGVFENLSEISLKIINIKPE